MSSPHRHVLARSLVLLALLALLLGACVSEGERAAPDTSVDTTAADLADTNTDPCPTQGARECVSATAARACEGGSWVTTACAEGASCVRSTGACARGTSSCFGTLACHIDCEQGDQACPEACSAAATVAAVDALGNLNTCQCEDDCWPILCGRLFPWPTYGEIAACVSDGCAEVAAACVGGGATGQGGCLTVRDCMLACSGDTFCAEGCFALGSAEAQTVAAFYAICVRKECGAEPSPTCLFAAQANRCADLWQACQDDEEPDEP